MKKNFNFIPYDSTIITIWIVSKLSDIVKTSLLKGTKQDYPLLKIIFGSAIPTFMLQYVIYVQFDFVFRGKVQAKKKKRIQTVLNKTKNVV